MYNILYKSHASNNRARDRARLGDKVYKRIEADKMKKWRASNRPPKPPVQQPQPQPAQQPQANKPSTKSQKTKAPQQLQRVPQQAVKDFVPLYKSPYAQPFNTKSIETYFSQFKKVYEHFTDKDVPVKLKNELTKVLEFKKI